MLLDYGYSETKAQQGADEIMAHFAYWRSRINVPNNTHQVLTQLAEKIPLIAITNGNANPLSCGLGQYFTHILRQGLMGALSLILICLIRRLRYLNSLIRIFCM